MNESTAYIIASSHFLSEELPVDWMEKEDDEILKFVSDNMIEPFYGYSPSEVWESIDCLAMDFLDHCTDDVDDVDDRQIEFEFGMSC